MVKILWKRGEIAPKEQFLLFSTIFCYLLLGFHIKTRTRVLLRDKRLFEIREVEITGVHLKETKNTLSRLRKSADWSFVFCCCCFLLLLLLLLFFVLFLFGFFFFVLFFLCVFFFYFSNKICFDLSCESSARQTIQMKYPVLFSLKSYNINFRMSSATKFA